jgi:hypothetical protein
MAFEKKNEKLLSLPSFYRRLGKHAGLAALMVAFSISWGTLGYRYFEGLSWIDSEYNAVMILTGMGPVSPLHHESSKIFASIYAVYGGIVLLAITGIVLAPLAHRLLHVFNLKEEEESD